MQCSSAADWVKGQETSGCRADIAPLPPTIHAPPMSAEAWSTKHGGIQRCVPLAGGDINEVERWILGDGTSVVCKQPLVAVDGLYEAEAAGLHILAQGPLRVPQVIAQGEQWLIIEDLGDGEPQPGLWEELGRGLAALHSITAPKFGFADENFIGSTRQPNPWTQDGHAFFATWRLRHLADLARASDSLSPFDHYRVHHLADRLKELIPAQPASLCHGDLWTGNLHVDQAGKPALLDPATYYGWAEADLAMTTLFGKLPEPVYAAYHEVRPLADGWWDRLPLYNLYHLLNHLHLFGVGYLGQVRTVLDRFS